MNGKQLKNSILQWAIQGKLVPQDPNDEPASVLLDKIRQEKERLIKEKKIKRDKNASIIYRGEDNSYYEKMLITGEVKCIDEEVPFEIPKGWEWCRLRDVIYPPKYGTSSKSLSNGDVPVLRMGNIQDGEVVYDKLVFSNNVEDNRKYLLQDGDLLFNRTNSAELVGKTAIFKGNRHVIYAGYLILLRPIKTNSEYLNYIFSSPYVRSYCKEVKTIGVQQCNINAEKVSQLLVPIAPFEEQMRIADKIKEVLPSVDKYSISQYNLDLLNVSLSECLKKSILQEAIQGRLVPQIAEEGTAKELLEQIKTEKQKLVKEGKLKKSALNDSIIFKGDDNKYYEQIGKKCLDITDEIPFVIPETWQWVRIRDVFQLNPKNEAEDEKLVAFIPMEKISAGYKSDFTFDTTKWGTIKKGFTHFANGDVAFAKITPCFQNRKSAIFHDLPNGIGAGTTELKVLRPYENTIDRWYLLYFLESPYFIDEATFKGTANQQRIVVGYLEDKLFPLPTQKEQQRIVAQIEKLFEQLH